MVAVVPDTEFPLDKLGHAGGGPQLGGVSTGHRARKQHLGQLALLRIGQARRAARRCLYLVYAVAFSNPLIAPAHDGTCGTAQTSGDFV